MKNNFKEGDKVLARDKDNCNWHWTPLTYLYTDSNGKHWCLLNDQVAYRWDEIKPYKGQCTFSKGVPKN